MVAAGFSLRREMINPATTNSKKANIFDNTEKRERRN